MPVTGIPETCTHERRPGITTCLYCLKEERQRRNAQRRRAAGRAAVGLLAGGGAIAALVGAMTVLKPEQSGVSYVMLDSAAVNQSGDVEPSAPAAAGNPTAEPRRPSVTPVIERGTLDLGDGIVATRTGDEVIVNFDTDVARTRFDWKFEMVVRSTLPRIYGDAASTALDMVPSGLLVRGDLLEELPDQGIAIALPTAPDDTMMVWPLTRPGRDGPIVVAYRVLTR